MNAIKSPWWQLFVPKLVTVLREGYSFKLFRADALAGLTVAIVAIPLAMALGIASGATPDKGLIAAVVAGFLVSALGGSRVQIGGPSAAAVVVVFNVIAAHGYDGLILTTLMAGAMLMFAGFSRLGTWIKFIPQTVIMGFTTGIAVIIFSSQIKDFFGLQMGRVPGDFFEKWNAFWMVRETINPSALALSAGCLLLIMILRKYAPVIPAFLLVVVVGALVVAGFHLPVETIGSTFGELPHTLPMPHFPDGMTFARMHELLPSAFTLAFLIGVESLLSAVVSDGMIDRRHRSNCELVGQGVANMASACFGGMPATGALSRTITNVRSGAKTPFSGMIHAFFILLAMMFLAPLASYIPLSALAAILVVVAWNMSEIQKLKHLMHAPWAERGIMLVTFILTVAVDLTVAIEVGVVLASIIFMHRMSEVVELETRHRYVQVDRPDRINDVRDDVILPQNVESYSFRGPLFFGVATQLIDLVEHLNPIPKAIILNMEHVPLIDVSGESAIRTFIHRCETRNIFVIFSGVQKKPMEILTRMGIISGAGAKYIFTDTYLEAVAYLKA
jgi:SulP family sulfate permease